VRWSRSGIGKSGRAWVICFLAPDSAVWLLVVYSKAKFDNLPAAFLAQLRKGARLRSEVQKFQADLLASVKQMRRGLAARVTKAKLPSAAEARASVGLSQRDFAQLLGVSPRTLQDW
jgi:DNA-binding XRE family transcriptional regulator